MVITIGPSWRVSIPLKSWSVNVMSGMLCRPLLQITCILLIDFRCLFQVECDVPLPPNPPDLVLTTVLVVPSQHLGLLSLDLSLSAQFPHLLLGLLIFRSRLLPLGLLSLGLLSLCRPYGFCSLLTTYLYNYPAWISSSILSLRGMHSSVLWPWLRWYWQYLLWSALSGERHLRDSMIRLVLRASSKIRARPVLRGVYRINLCAWGLSMEFGGLLS